MRTGRTGLLHRQMSSGSRGKGITGKIFELLIILIMAGQLSKFTMQHFDAWAPNITKNTHIVSMFGKQTQKVRGLMVELLAASEGATLDTMLSKLPTKEFETGDDYVWDVTGSTERVIPLVECRDENGVVVDANHNDNVGIGTAPFYLVFDENWFFKGETIEGNLGNKYPLRVLEDAREEGSRYVYKVETLAGITDGVPKERLLPNEKFSYGAAFVEGGLSRRVGGIRHAIPATIRNEWSHIRIHHKVSGDMMDDKLAISVLINKGKGVKPTPVNSWMLNVDYEVEKTFRNYKNYAYAWGRSNRNRNGEYTNIGVSGDAIRTGAGMYELMEQGGNTIYYNDAPLKMIEEALYALFAGRVDFKDRAVTVRGGERGIAWLQQEASKEGSGWKSVYELAGVALGLAKKTTAAHAPFGGAISVATPQVTELIAPMGIKITFEVDQSKDNAAVSGIKLMHPRGGLVSSYMFDILDLGSSVEPNIQKCKIKGHPDEWVGYEAGIRNPFTGDWNNTSMSNDEDAAVIHKMADTGIVIWDPTRTVRVLPDILE